MFLFKPILFINQNSNFDKLFILINYNNQICYITLKIKIKILI